MTGDDFTEVYCRAVEFNTIKRFSLIEKPNFDCIFWAGGGCTVYKHRPLQCRTYPFWPQNLVGKTAWDKAGEECPGINQGKKHSYREIKKILSQRGFEPFLT